MLDFLSHNEAPISDVQWDEIDQTVIEVARRGLVGRRFIEIYGPLGAGAQWVALDRFDDGEVGGKPGHIDFLGEDGGTALVTASRVNMHIPLIYKDFVLFWRDVEASRKFNIPLDFSAAAAGAAACARAEDEMIFLGYKDKSKQIDYPGLLSVEGRQSIQQGNWDEPGAVFGDVVKATEKLASAGHYGPYVMVAPPQIHSKIHRYVNTTGMMEIEYIRQLATDGVFFSSVIPENRILVASTGVQNFDLAIGQDLKTAYLGAQNMNHPFRVFETIVLRIKRPGAICVVEGKK